MKEERLNPLNDYLFMKYMGEPGDEEQLLAFLNAVLHKTGRDGIVSVKIEKYTERDRHRRKSASPLAGIF